MIAPQTLVIGEDHGILRAGLRAVLDAEADLAVVGETDRVDGALALVAAHSPALIVIGLDAIRAIEAMREIKRQYPQIQLLLLTHDTDEDSIRTALQAGANGYVLKDASKYELLMAVRSLLAGKIFLSPSISAKVVNGFLTGGPDRPKTQWDLLTAREREILKLIAEGRTSKHIAGALTLSVKTVEKHRYNLMKKLDLHNVSSLTAFAISRGLVRAAI